MSAPSFFTRVSDAFADGTHELLNDNYSSFKKSLREFAMPVELVGLVAGVAGTIFGLIAVSFSSVVTLLLGVGCGVAAYNSFQLAANIRQISDNPARYYIGYALGLETRLEKKRLKQDLALNTLGCAFFIERAVDEMDQAMKEAQAPDRLYRSRSRRY